MSTTTDTNQGAGLPVTTNINAPGDLRHHVRRVDTPTGIAVLIATFLLPEDAQAFAAAHQLQVHVPETPKRLILKYRAPGARPGTTRWATRPVADTMEAVAWMNANPEIAGLPAFVQTRGWRPQTLSILGPLRAPVRG